MDEQIEKFRNDRSRLNERILAKENDASILKRVYAMDTFAYLDRNAGLSAKQKEMLGLVSSMVLRCDDCIKYHLERCFELAVANDEMMDIFGIANVVGGTIVIPHTRRAIEYWELLNNERDFSAPFAETSKRAKYEELMLQIKSMLEGLTNNISKMATIVEVLKSNIPYFYWVGFYLSDKDRLSIGPYQGTHGCIFIDYNKGVCGRVASQRKTIIVDDIQALNDKQGASKGELHISCDARSQSEIALPVVAKNGNLIAVFDVDSLSKKAFATIDQEYLEMILKEHF